MSSFGALLTVLLVGLKLTGHIAWPWLWVLAPVCIPTTLVLGTLLAGLIAAAILNR
jgi:hypothetical protein